MVFSLAHGETWVGLIGTTMFGLKQPLDHVVEQTKKQTLKKVNQKIILYYRYRPYKQTTAQV